MDKCPMNGQPCQHQKVIHVTELDGGCVKESHLCYLCGGQAMHQDKPKGDPALVLINLIGNLLKAKKEPVQKPSNKAPCPSCGITLEEIAKSGKVGCGICYSHFVPEMKIVLAHTHGAVGHTGKIPPGWKEEQAKKKEIEEHNGTIEERIRSYKEKMKKAIEVENYEAAGDLKRLIESLQQQMITDPPKLPSSEGL
jgi:protein arginine kinase activator